MRNGIIIPMLLIIAFLLRLSPKQISFSSQNVNILALAKLLFLAKGIFPGKASTNFSIFLNQNILFLECPKRARTYISDAI